LINKESLTNEEMMKLEQVNQNLMQDNQELINRLNSLELEIQAREA
jgi:hypothetical protein